MIDIIPRPLVIRLFYKHTAVTILRFAVINSSGPSVIRQPREATA